MAAKKYFIYTLIILFCRPIAIFGMRRGIQLVGRNASTFIRRSNSQLLQRKNVSNFIPKRRFHKPTIGRLTFKTNQVIYRKPTTRTLFRRNYREAPKKTSKQRLFWQTGFGKRLTHTGRTIRKSKLAKWFGLGGTTAMGISGASALKLVTDRDRLNASVQNPEQLIAQMQKENAAETYIPFLINNANKLVNTPEGTRVLQAGLLIFADQMEIKQIEKAILPNLTQLNNAQTPEDTKQVTFFFNQLLNKKPKIVTSVSKQTIRQLDAISTHDSTMPLINVLLQRDSAFANNFMQVISDNPSHSFVTNVGLLAQNALEDRFNILYKIGKDRPEYHKPLLAALSQEKSGGKIRLFETKAGGLLLQNILKTAPAESGWLSKSSAPDFNKKTVQKNVSNMFNSLASLLQTTHKDNLPLIDKLLQTKGITNFKAFEQIGAELPNILYANPDTEQFLKHLLINNDTVRERLLKQMRGKTLGQSLLGQSKVTVPPTFKAFVYNITHPRLSAYKTDLLQAIQDKPISVPLTQKNLKYFKQPKPQLSLTKALENQPKKSWKSYFTGLPKTKIPNIWPPKFLNVKFIR